MRLVNYLVDFVIVTSKLFKIDESHSITHSLEVLDFANQIYHSEKVNKPYLENHEKIICSSAILHDMCDKKYMAEEIGIIRIKELLESTSLMSQKEIDVTLKIISTMSYSKVKKCGYPNDLDEYTMAYHIVREADLLAAYDFNRCIIYGMMTREESYEEAVKNATTLFNTRILKHNEDDLFITDYSKQTSLLLHKKALNKINNCNYFLKNSSL